MSYPVIWLTGKMASYRRLRAADPNGARRIASVIGSLASDPYPVDSNALGGTAFRRIRLDRYRVLYEVQDTEVRIMHVGRVTDRLPCRGAVRAHRQALARSSRRASTVR
jgi:mRNA-degrading endonuclease RelE of RelBE toxin-antitoxin system